MEDLEKVIKGLNCHINHDCRDNSCPYAINDACASDLFLDAIEMLKEYKELKEKERTPCDDCQEFSCDFCSYKEKRT